MRRKYTQEHIEFLQTGYRSMSLRDLVPAFNAQFDMRQSRSSIVSALKNHGIKCGSLPAGRLMPLRIYTFAQAQFLRDNYPGCSVVELTAIFNERFHETRTNGQIRTFVHNRGIVSGRTGCFEKGHKPWNAGTKGQSLTGPNIGSFKPGHIPLNRRPLGAERIDSKDGYILVKVKERNPYSGAPTRYKLKHVVIWELHHGRPVPRGMVVIFADGNKRNFTTDNLRLISRADLLHLNRFYAGIPGQMKAEIMPLVELERKIIAIKRKSASSPVMPGIL